MKRDKNFTSQKEKILVIGYSFFSKRNEKKEKRKNVE